MNKSVVCFIAISLLCAMSSIALADTLLYYDYSDEYIKKLDLDTMKISPIVKMKWVGTISSSSGNHLVYSCYEGNRAIVKQDTISGTHTDWFSGSVPSCSPKDNEIIAYFDQNIIRLLDHRGEKHRSLKTVAREVYRVKNISWSPDGTRIAYDYQKQKTSNSSRQYMAIYDLSTKQTTQLGIGEAPNWSPNGKSIIYGDVKEVGESRESNVVNLDLSTRKKTVIIKDAFEAKYLSDGKSFICIKSLQDEDGNGLYFYNPTTKKCKLISKMATSLATYHR